MRGNDATAFVHDYAYFIMSEDEFDAEDLVVLMGSRVAG